MSVTEEEIKVVVLVALVALVLTATFVPGAVLMLCSGVSPTPELQRLELAATVAQFTRRLHLFNVTAFLFLEATWSPLSRFSHVVFASAPSEAILFFLCLLVCVLLQVIFKDIRTAVNSFFSQVGRSLQTGQSTAHKRGH